MKTQEELATGQELVRILGCSFLSEFSKPSPLLIISCEGEENEAQISS